MSEERFQSLVNQYPEYAQIFREVLRWFTTHPKQQEVSLEFFYTNKYSFKKEDLNVAFFILNKKDVVKKTYVVIDESGTKVGRNFEKMDDIPDELDTMMGDKKETKDLFVVPYYSLRT